MSDNIKVVIKIRPLIKREKEQKLTSQWRVKDNTITTIENPQTENPYCFDHIFDENSQNDDLFCTVAKPIVQSCIRGINGTIFAYGQTSSGKTYSMTGTNDNPGVMILAIRQIFDEIEMMAGRHFLLRISYIEIYNEKIYDLLNTKNLEVKIRDANTNGNVQLTCSEIIVNSADQMLRLLHDGNLTRRMEETNMNERSSRSHTIFRITIESSVQRPKSGDYDDKDAEYNAIQSSILNLVDLAGSEKADQTGATGTRLKEGAYINKSLFSLGLVIKQLSDNQGNEKFINYRDSKLTRILQSSIGGNSMTSIICTVTPAVIDETNYTLSFASRAKKIKNQPIVNETVSDATMMRRLNLEILRLKKELEQSKNSKIRIAQIQHDIEQRETQFIVSQSYRGRDKIRRRTWCPSSHSHKENILDTVLEETFKTPTNEPEIFDNVMFNNSTLFDINSSQYLIDSLPGPSWVTDERRDSVVSITSQCKTCECESLRRELEDLQSFTRIEKISNEKSEDDNLHQSKQKVKQLEVKLDIEKARSTEYQYKLKHLEEKLQKFNEMEDDYLKLTDKLTEAYNERKAVENLKSCTEYEMEQLKKRSQNRESELIELLEEARDGKNINKLGHEGRIQILQEQLMELEKVNLNLTTAFEKEHQNYEELKLKYDKQIRISNEYVPEVQAFQEQIIALQTFIKSIDANDTINLNEKLKVFNRLIDDENICNKSFKTNNYIEELKIACSSSQNSIPSLIISDEICDEKLIYDRNVELQNRIFGLENQLLQLNSQLTVEQETQEIQTDDSFYKSYTLTLENLKLEKLKIQNEYDELSSQFMDLVQDNENEKLRYENQTHLNIEKDNRILELEELNKHLKAESNELNLKHNKEIQNQILILENEIKVLQNDKLECADKLKSVTEEKISLELNLNEFKELILSKDDSIKTLENEKYNLENQIRELLQKKTQNEKEISNITSQLDSLESCTTELDNLKITLNDKNKLIEDLEQEKLKLETDFTNFKNQFDETLSFCGELSKFHGNSDEIPQHSLEKDKIIKKLEEEKLSISDLLENIQSKYNHLIEDHHKLKNENSKIEMELKMIGEECDLINEVNSKLKDKLFNLEESFNHNKNKTDNEVSIFNYTADDTIIENPTNELLKTIDQNQDTIKNLKNKIDEISLMKSNIELELANLQTNYAVLSNDCEKYQQEQENEKSETTLKIKIKNLLSEIKEKDDLITKYEIKNVRVTKELPNISSEDKIIINSLKEEKSKLELAYKNLEEQFENLSEEYEKLKIEISDKNDIDSYKNNDKVDNSPLDISGDDEKLDIEYLKNIIVEKENVIVGYEQSKLEFTNIQNQYQLLTEEFQQYKIHNKDQLDFIDDSRHDDTKDQLIQLQQRLDDVLKSSAELLKEKEDLIMDLDRFKNEKLSIESELKKSLDQLQEAAVKTQTLDEEVEKYKTEISEKNEKICKFLNQEIGMQENFVLLEEKATELSKILLEKQNTISNLEKDKLELNELKSNIKSEFEQLQMKTQLLEEDISEKDKQILKYSNQEVIIKENLMVLEEKLTELNETLLEKEKIIDNLEKEKIELVKSNTDRDFEVFQAKIKSLEQILSEKDEELLKHSNQEISMQEKITELNAILEEKSTELNEMILQNEKIIFNLKKDNIDLTEYKSNIITELDKVQMKIQSLEQEMSEKDEKFLNLQDNSTELLETKNIIKDFETIIIKIKLQYQLLINDCDEIKNQIIVKDDLVTEIEKLHSMLDSNELKYDSEKSKLNDRLNNLQKQSFDLEKTNKEKNGIIKNLTKENNDIKLELEKVRLNSKSFIEEIEKYKIAIKNNEDVIENCNSELNILQRKSNTLEKEKLELEDKIKVNLTVSSINDGFNNKLLEKDVCITNLQSDLESLKKNCEHFKVQLNEKENIIQNCELTNNIALDQIQTLEENINDMKNKYTILKEEHAKIQNTLDEEISIRDENENTIQNLNRTKEKLEDDIVNLNKQISTGLGCYNLQLNEKDKIILNLNEELRLCKRNVETLNQTVTDKEILTKNLEEDKSELNNKIKHISTTLTKNNTTLKEINVENTKSIKKLKEEIVLIKNETKILNENFQIKSQECDAAKLEVKSLKKTLEEKEEQLLTIKNDNNLNKTKKEELLQQLHESQKMHTFKCKQYEEKLEAQQKETDIARKKEKCVTNTIERLQNEVKTLNEKVSEQRKIRRNSSYDNNRLSLLTRDVEVMTDKTDYNCNCEQLNEKILHLQKENFLKECHIERYKIESKNNPLITECEDLKKKYIQNEILRNQLENQIIQLQSGILKKRQLNTKTVTIQTENKIHDDIDFCSIKSKYEEYKKLYHRQIDKIKNLENMNNEKENVDTKNSDRLKCAEVEFKKLESKYSIMENELKDVQSRYVQLTTKRAMTKSIGVNTIHPETNCAGVQTDFPYDILDSNEQALHYKKIENEMVRIRDRYESAKLLAIARRMKIQQLEAQK